MASPEMQAFLDGIAKQPDKSELGPIDVQRKTMDEFMADQPMPANVLVDNYKLAERPARKYFRSGVREDASLLYFHGGGYRVGSLDSHHAFTAHLAVACKTAVNALDYRLAPENPYPAAVDDAVTAYKEMLQYTAGDKIMLAGDSAGGGLTLACLLRLQDEGLPMPGCAALLSPHLDLTCTNDLKGVSRKIMLDSAKLYAGDFPLDTVGVSPLLGEMHGLPPLLIQVAKGEMLESDSVRLAERASAAGVSVEMRVFDEAFHVFQIFTGFPESQDALRDISDFYNRHI
ncbi:MAG: alpha/beta hydrolase [Woeseiaceae bacterium]